MIEIHGTKIKSKPFKKRSIVLLSGGIDSVFLLVKLLRETDDVVLAHHIHLMSQSGPHQIEAIRCRQILEYCRKQYRYFEYSESAIDHRGLVQTGEEIIASALEAGVVSRSYSAKFKRPTDRWIFGWCKEKQYSFDNHSHIHKAFVASCFPYPVPKVLRFPEISRTDQYSYLPKSLSALCWSCKNPTLKGESSFEECGACSACLLKKKIETQETTNPEFPGIASVDSSTSFWEDLKEAK